MGSWIGGDRDGNPFVTAEVLRETLRMQSRRALGFYLDELHALGGELSLARAARRRIGRAARAGRAASPDRSPHRGDEPYRRAITGIYARLAATHRTLDDFEPPAPPVAPAAPYADARRTCADLDIDSPLAARQRLGLLARGRCAAAARGRRVRLPSGADRPAAELRRARAGRRRTVRTAAPGTDYRAGRSGAHRRAARRARHGAPAGLALHGYSDERGELAIFARPRPRTARLSARRRRAELHHLQDRQRLRPARSRAAAQGGGLLRPRERALDVNIVPLFETIDDLRLRGDHGRAAFAAGYRRCSQPRRRAGSDARLFGQQQGRRLPHLELGAVQGRDRALVDVFRGTA
jgi:phosphoenolpyruvate carboxylase